jgi:hypothetical protein
MVKRSGVTLVEVLVAIFVTSMGLIALMALFPVGALNMARAVQGNRAVQCATNGNAVAIVKTLKSDTNIVPLFNATNTTPGIPATYPATAPDPTGPSYPVVVDYVGWLISGGTGTTPTMMATTAISPGIPRIAPTFITTPPTGSTSALEAIRWLTLGDEFTFYVDGNPSGALTGGPLLRERRYSWSYLVQLPTAGTPPSTSGAVNLTVIVYSSRSQAVLGELSYPVDWSAVTNNNSVVVNYGAAGLPRPAIKVGQWVLDATVVTPKAGGGFNPDPHGDFYRVVNVTDASATSVLLEFEQQIRHTSGPGTGVLCVMDNVIEVFNRSTLQ